MRGMFDLTTAIFSYALIFAAGIVMLTTLWRQNRAHQKWLSFFLISYLVAIGAGVLTLFSGQRMNSVFLEAPLFVLSTILLYDGVSHLTEQSISQKHNYALAGALAVVELVFTFLYPNWLVRSLAFLITLVAIYGQIIWLVFVKIPPKDRSPFSRGIGYIFIAYILITIAYGAGNTCFFIRQDFSRSNSVDAATLILHQTLFVLLTFLLFLMMNRRLIGEHEQDMVWRQRAEAALQNSEERYRRLEERLGKRAVFFTRTMDGHFTYLSPGVEDILGIPPEQLISRHWKDIVEWLPGAIRRSTQAQKETLSNRRQHQIDELILAYQHPDGTVHYLQVEQYVLRDKHGNPTFVEGIAQEVTARVLAEKSLADSEARYRDLFENTSDLIQVISEDGGLIYVNPAWKTTLGYSEADLEGLSIFDVIHPDDKADCKEKFVRLLEGNAIDLVRVRFIRKDGGIVVLTGNLRCYCTKERPVFAQGIFHDITHQVQIEQQLQHAATHDALTGLPNRTLFCTRLEQAIKTAARRQERLAVLFADLDGFKDINDTYGHHTGDQLLSEFTRRVSGALRQSDIAARLSGDEFALICEGIRTRRDAATIARKILAACAPPYRIQGNDITLTVSIGISIYPEDGDTVDALLQRADAAMYHVKQEGKNNYAFFLPLEKTEFHQAS